MVVKSATKKKLQDLGFSEAMAHLLADDRKWGDIENMSPNQIYEIIMDSKASYLVDGMTYEQKVALWRKLGRLEIKVVKTYAGDVDTDRVSISVPYLSDDFQASYNFKTDRLTTNFEGFRGLGSLFSNEDSIFDWHFVNILRIPKDADDGYVMVLNQLQNKKLATILKRMESNYLFPTMPESINRSDILTLWDEIPEDDWDGLGSLFG
jgi:hypothetical protein